MSAALNAARKTLKTAIAKPLSGVVAVPGDKSISHRALMLSSLAVGRSEITGLLLGEDIRATAAAMRAMGAYIDEGQDGIWRVDGVGVGGLMEPADILDMGNSGTSARLISGLIASHNITATITGDNSLRGRPMARVTTPLADMGASFSGREGMRLPMTITGTAESLGIDYTPPVASAQVKSAILLAGLNTLGTTTIRESIATRDHSERMLSAMGADIISVDAPDSGRVISITGPAELSPQTITVPGDISSAAFLLVAASIIKGSDITITGVGLNPLRTGIVDALQAMGADISISNRQDISGEPVGDLRVRYAGLKPLPDGVPCHPSIMIDEFPILFVAAAAATGTSRFTGLEELRVKESDRIALMAQGLSKCGVNLEETEDGIIIHGSGSISGGAAIETALDHRIAMSHAVLGQIADQPITIDDASPMNTSFPGFIELMQGLGAGFGGGV